MGMSFCEVPGSGTRGPEIKLYRRCCKCQNLIPVETEALALQNEEIECPGEGCSHLLGNDFFNDCERCFVCYEEVGLEKKEPIAVATRAGLGIVPHFETPWYWKCHRDQCGRVQEFPNAKDGGFRNAEGNKKKHRGPLSCEGCGDGFRKMSWVYNRYRMCLGTWDGSTVACGGPWWFHII